MTIFAKIMDLARPQGQDDPSEADDEIRLTKAAIQERLNVEHVFDLTGTEVSGENSGKHTAITCDSVASVGAVSGTDITGTGDLAITGAGTIGGALRVIGAAELGDGSWLAAATESGDGPRAIADKAYVDAAPAAQMTPTAYAGEESITFPNGLILKHGNIASVGGNATAEVTYGTAFPSGVISVSATFRSTSTAIAEPALAHPKTISPKTVIQITNCTNTSFAIDWQAWGF